MTNALSLAAAGRAAGTTRQTVWAWERGRGHPSPEQLRRMNDLHPGLTGLLGLCPRRMGQ